MGTLDPRDLHSNTAESDPLLQLCGSGSQLWADEHADQYVSRLRADWEGAAPVSGDCTDST